MKRIFGIYRNRKKVRDLLDLLIEAKQEGKIYLCIGVGVYHIFSSRMARKMRSAVST